MEPQLEESQSKEALIPSEEEVEESPPSETKATQESESPLPPKMEELNEPANKQPAKTEDNSDETNLGQETEIKPSTDTRNATGTWGNVPWTWEGSTQTITLQGGTARTSSAAPWRTHRDVIRIVVEEKVVLPINCSHLFWSLENLERIEQAGNFDTSNVTSMYVMFWDATSLTTLDASDWDTRNVTRMDWMFYGAHSLTTLDASNWNTTSVTRMEYMFMNTSSLTTLDVSNWDTRNVTDMVQIFYRASSLTTLDVSNWDTRNVTNMQIMFREASSLTTLDVSNWDTRNVTNMQSMFRETSGLNVLDLSEWDTMRVSSADDMFTGATSLSTVHLGIKSRFDHLSDPPAMPEIHSSEQYTGDWVYYLDQAGTIPEAYLAPSSNDFWRTYDGANPGTYTWQTKGKVAVHYRDITDQEITDPLIITGGIHAPFQVEEKAIDGYTVQEIPTSTSGRFKAEEQLVIFRYIKNTVDPVDPLNPVDPVDPENKPDLPEDQGLLSIDFVSGFQFGTQILSAQERVYYAQPQRLLQEDGTINEQEERPNYVQISDRRPQNERHGWQLAVRQNEQFKGPQGQELIGARLHLTNQQLVTAHGGKAPSLQATNPLALVPGNRRTLIRAEENEGTGTWIYRFGDASNAATSVALEVPQGATPEATQYKTALMWELSAVPGND